MPPEAAEAQTKSARTKSPNKPSYEQILEARAHEVSESGTPRTGSAQQPFPGFKSEQTKLAEDKKRYKQLRDGFDSQLLSMREGSAAAGKDEVRRTLESIKPKQAKALLLEMLNNKEIDDVVTLLSPMPDSKRAKIFGEFKTPDELEKLSEVLRRIREGLPSASVPETTRKQLEQLKTSQL